MRGQLCALYTAATMMFVLSLFAEGNDGDAWWEHGLRVVAVGYFAWKTVQTIRARETRRVIDIKAPSASPPPPARKPVVVTMETGIPPTLSVDGAVHVLDGRDPGELIASLRAANVPVYGESSGSSSGSRPLVLSIRDRGDS
jgi:hypothetical protein